MCKENLAPNCISDHLFIYLPAPGGATAAWGGSLFGPPEPDDIFIETIIKNPSNLFLFCPLSD